MAAVVPAGTDGWGFKLAASALVLATLSCPRAADAQSPQLEAAYVVLGPQGPVARAVLAQASACPTITIDGAQQPMNVRALPDATFPVLVCERPIPAGVTSASVENLPLPLPKATLKSIAAFGDTGCRLKAAKAATKGGNAAADEDRGKFQDCNNPALWPFVQVAQSVADAKPDLVIHLGDYLYRESCPPGTPAVRVALATIGQPGRRIFSRLRPRHSLRHRGLSCAAITRSAAVPGRLFQAARPDARSDDASPGAALHRPDPAVHRHAGEQSFIVLDLEQCRRYLSVRSRPLRGGFAARSPSPARGSSPIARSGARSAPPNRQWQLAGSVGELERQAARRHRTRLGSAISTSWSSADKRSPQFVLGTGGTLPPARSRLTHRRDDRRQAGGLWSS